MRECAPWLVGAARYAVMFFLCFFQIRLDTPLPLWCTDPVYEDLTQGNPILGVLGHFCGVARQSVPLDGTPFQMPGVEGVDFMAMPLVSKAAPWAS